MKTKFLSLLLLPLFIFACANEAQESNERQQEESHENHQHDVTQTDISLNEGQPWKVHDNMMTFIKSMNQEVANFSGKTYNDYQVLAMSLQENIDGLTSNCTMTGQAHDELHKWLLPYIDTVNDFAKADNEENAAAEFKKVKSAFVTFNQFFQ